MTKIVEGKPSANMYIDALAIAGCKTLEERLLAPVVGNGTFVSGAVKGALGLGIPMVAGQNKWTKLIGTAFMVDSAEDVLNAILKMIGWGSGPHEQGVVI